MRCKTLSCLFNAATPLLGLFTIPAEYFSCFCAGTATGDSGVLESSAVCFAEPFTLPYKVYGKSLKIACYMSNVHDQNQVPCFVPIVFFLKTLKICYTQSDPKCSSSWTFYQ